MYTSYIFNIQMYCHIFMLYDIHERCAQHMYTIINCMSSDQHKLSITLYERYSSFSQFNSGINKFIKCIFE